MADPNPCSFEGISGAGSEAMNPNPDNVGTLEACQRLQAAGIVLKTEAWWNLCGSGKDAQWRLERVKCPGSVPAPCFTEVWRELPEDNGRLIVLMEKWLSETRDDWFHCDPELCFLETVRDINALIDLLIWARKEIKP